MDPIDVGNLLQHALKATFLMAAPMLGIGLLIGLLVSIVQAATQINEQTLAFIPKLVGVFLALIIAGPWMLTIILDYMHTMFSGIPAMVQ